MPKNKSIHAEMVEADRPIYKIWQGLYLSFFSFPFYVDVIKRWKGLGLGYLLLAMLLFCIPLGLRVTILFDQYIQTNIVQLLQRVPLLVIQNGKVQLDKPMPDVIKDKSGQPIIVVDTRKNTRDLFEVFKFPQVKLLITQDQIYIRLPFIYLIQQQRLDPMPPKVSVFSIPPSTNEIFDGPNFIQHVHIAWLLYLAPAVLYLFIVSLFFSSFAFFFMLIGVLARFVGKLILRVSLSYVQACRLLIVSASPAMLLILILFGCDKLFFGVGVVFMALVCTYFSIAALVYRRQAQVLVRV